MNQSVEKAAKEFAENKCKDIKDETVRKLSIIIAKNDFAAGYLAGSEAKGDDGEFAQYKKRAEFTILILEGEIRSLRADKLRIQKEAGLDPYWYWPQCDVEGCEQVSSSGGCGWRETGYWSLCPDHMDMHRKGEPQPQMKQSAIDKEKTRDERGYLPSPPKTKQ